MQKESNCVHNILFLFFRLIAPNSSYSGNWIWWLDEVYDKLVGEPRDQNKANFNKVRQIAKFGMIVYYKIVINNLI